MDYNGRQVVLTKRCYEYHTSPERVTADVHMRQRVLPLVPQVLKRPRYVYYDGDNPRSSKVRYIDLVVVPGTGDIKALVVIVDVGREPAEVVTWLVETKLKQEKTAKGGLIYDGGTLR
ncbi:MAG: PBECR2 nuclease fold domain-containing protein [Desulfotomaculales bacterium]